MAFVQCGNNLQNVLVPSSGSHGTLPQPLFLIPPFIVANTAVALSYNLFQPRHLRHNVSTSIQDAFELDLAELPIVYHTSL